MKIRKNRRTEIVGVFWRRDGRALSFIGEGIAVVGSLEFGNGEVRLDGRLEGKILGQGTLLVGEKGSLRGEADVGALVLYGRVDGVVVASDSIRIARGGRLCGRVHAVRLIVEEGGVFDGESDPYSIPASASGKSPVPAGKP
jgi:cytoskeletal protein CcmA (bactofilin family)